MIVYTAPQLGEGGPPSAQGTTPTTALGAMLSNLSPWWLLFSMGDRAPYNIPPFSAFRVPMSQGSEPWTLEPTTFDPGQLTVGQTYVELDFSTTTLPLELRTMAQLPVYQQQVGGGVDILNQPTVNIAAGASVAITGAVTIETAPGTPIEVSGGVSISGAVTVQTAAGSPISVTGGVTITGTAQVSITGTPTFQLAPGATVDISSGNVTIVGGQGGINVSVETAPQVAGNLTTPSTGVSSAQLIITPPAGATGMRVEVNLTGSGYGVSSISCQGATSGREYFPQLKGRSLNINEPVEFSCQVDGSAEQLNISVDFVLAPPASTVVGEVIWLFGYGTTTVNNNTYQPAYVEGTQGAAGQSVQTVREPPQNPGAVSVGIPASSGATVLTGADGKSIRPRKGALRSNTSTTGSWALQSSSGVKIFSMDAAWTGIIQVDFEGIVLPAGDDLLVVGETMGSGSYLSGYLNYDLF